MLIDNPNSVPVIVDEEDPGYCVINGDEMSVYFDIFVKMLYLPWKE